MGSGERLKRLRTPLSKLNKSHFFPSGGIAQLGERLKRLHTPQRFMESAAQIHF